MPNVANETPVHTPDNKNVVLNNDATTEEKKPRKPREKVRPVEETIDLPVSKLTEKEKDALIKHLKEEVNLLVQKNDACRETADSAFSKCRQLEDMNNRMEDFYRRKLKYVDTQLEAFHSAINAAIKGVNN